MKNLNSNPTVIQLGLFGENMPVVPGSAAEQPGGRPIRRGKAGVAVENAEGRLIWSSALQMGLTVDFSYPNYASQAFTKYYVNEVLRKEDFNYIAEWIGYSVAMGCNHPHSYNNPKFLQALKGNVNIIYQAQERWMKLAFEFNPFLRMDQRIHIIRGFNQAMNVALRPPVLDAADKKVVKKGGGK